MLQAPRVHQGVPGAGVEAEEGTADVEDGDVGDPANVDHAPLQGGASKDGRVEGGEERGALKCSCYLQTWPLKAAGL